MKDRFGATSRSAARSKHQKMESPRLAGTKDAHRVEQQQQLVIRNQKLQKKQEHSKQRKRNETEQNTKRNAVDNPNATSKQKQEKTDSNKTNKNFHEQKTKRNEQQT